MQSKHDETYSSYYAGIIDGLTSLYSYSIDKKSKRVNNTDQFLDILFEQHLNPSIIGMAHPKLLPSLIHIQLILKFWGNPSTLNPSTDADKGSLLTTMGRMAIYDVSDPRDLEYVPGRDFEKGITLLTTAMELNYSNAHYCMGYLYQHGLKGKVEPDYKKAIEYYEQAIALDNNPKALYQLAKMHLYGHGFTKNIQEALVLLEHARALNHLDAILTLGHLYKENDELPRECALQYYREAAKLNSGVGIRMLAEMSFSGDGVEKDPIKACQLYRKAWLIDGDLHSRSELIRLQKADYPAMDCKTRLCLKYHGCIGVAEIEHQLGKHKQKYADVYSLLKSDPEVIWNCIISDNLLSAEEKSELTNQSFENISPILEVERYCYRSLYLKNKENDTHYWDHHNKFIRIKIKDKCMIDALKILREKVLMNTLLTAEKSNEIINKCSSRPNLLDCWINLLGDVVLQKPYSDSKNQQEMFMDLICKLESKKNSILFKNQMLFFSLPDVHIDLHRVIVDFAITRQTK